MATYPMSRDDKDKLEINRAKLMPGISLDGGTLLANLRANGVLEQSDEEVIRAEPGGNTQQVGKMLDILLKKDNLTLPKFTAALKASGYTALAEHCFGTERPSGAEPVRERFVQPEPPPEPRLLSYTRQKKLGAGAFGQVWLYRHNNTGLLRAVKQVTIDSPSEEMSKEVKALQNEIESLKNLEHVRIVRYYGSEETDNVLSIFMDYAPRGSINVYLSNHGALSEAVTRKYTRQALEGLVYLHQHKPMIIHRDIKGANILLFESDSIKLSDFGCSKRLTTIRTSKGAKTFTGTPHWMSPEAIKGEEKPYGRKTDVWSLGCTVVEMLTKNPPWHKFEGHTAIFKIGSGNYPEYELPPNMSDGVKHFLQLCFEQKPSDRPSSDQLLEQCFERKPHADAIERFTPPWVI